MAVSVDDAMTVRAAAHFLEVSEKQVQHLGRRGDVRYVARGLVDGASVRHLHARRQGRHTRGWSPRTAWAAIALLSGRNAQWLGQGQVSRLRTRLRVIDSAGLVAATRDRAVIGRFAGHASATNRLSAEPTTVRRRALPGLVGHSRQVEPDWYVDVRDLDRLVRTYSLRPHVRGNLVLRAVHTGDRLDGEGVSLDLVRTLMDNDVLVALDAATSEDPRERGVATRMVSDALTRFRERE